MKKLLKFFVLLLVVGLIFSLAGCSTGNTGKEKEKEEEKKEEEQAQDIYAQYYEGDYRNNRTGTVEIVNNTAHDMLLFSGEAISPNYIIGGVKAYSTNTVNFSTETDYQVGGYKVIHAVKQTEFDAFGQNSKIDHSAMVTYRNDTRSRTNIVSTTDGDYQFVANNKNTQYALELRKNRPDGEKVAYLSKSEQRRIIKSPSNASMTLFPVWIAFNNVTKTIVTFTPSDVGDTWEGWRDVTPRAPNDSQGQSDYNFPDSDIDIAFTNIDFPFATVIVRNLGGRDIDFRIAGARLTAQSDYTSIPSGFRDSYEITASSTGEELDLRITMQNGSMVIPVRFEEAPDAPTVEIQNGYEYSVNFRLKTPASPPSDVNSYEAILKEERAIDKKDLLVSG